MAFTIWDFKKKRTITGKLTAKLSNIPPFGKRVYGITIKDGTQFHVWGSYQVVGHLAPLPFGTELALTYLGKGEVVPGKPEQHMYECKVLNIPKGAVIQPLYSKKLKGSTPNTNAAPRGKQAAKKGVIKKT